MAGMEKELFEDYLKVLEKPNPAAKPQPMPEGQGQEVLEEVIKDLRDRSREGVRKYGTPLRINNGRDAMMDFYQEMLDGIQYFKQFMMERDKDASTKK